MACSKIITVCLCCLRALTYGAVIEVTAGGSVNVPTYQFSDTYGASVATLTGNVSDGKITASGVFEATDVQTTAGASLNGKMDAMTVDGTPTHLSANLVSSGGVFDALAALGLAVSNAPVTTLLTPASCTASTSSDPAHDALYGSTCESAYNGNDAQAFGNWWLVTASRADADFWYQLVLSNVSTVTRIVFLQLVNVWGANGVASRVVIAFYDASDTLMWKKYHDCVTVRGQPYVLGPDDLFLFPFVAGVSKIRFTFQGWHSHNYDLLESYARRGFKSLEIYGVATG